MDWSHEHNHRLKQVIHLLNDFTNRKQFAARLAESAHMRSKNPNGQGCERGCNFTRPSS
jgi:hypothetical protein